VSEESDKKIVARLEEVKTITEPEGDYEQIMEEAMEDVDYDQITVDYTQPEQAQQLKVHVFTISKISIFAEISNLNSMRPAQF
jgi:predicted RNA-binding protein